MPITAADFERYEDETRPHCLRVRTVAKEYELAAANEDAVDEWLRVLRSQKVVAVKQSLGHLPMSYDDAVANAAGDFLCQKKYAELAREEEAAPYAHENSLIG